MAFCSRCRTQVETDALSCPNCGTPVTLHAIPDASQSPQLASRLRKYFSKPSLSCILLPSILVFAVLIVSGRQGEQVTVVQAQRTLMEIEKEFPAVNFFSHNVQIALIFFIPILGSAWMVLVQYPTGYILGNIAKGHGVSFLSLLLVTLSSPTGLSEYSTYILTLNESFMIIYSIITKKARQRLTQQSWKTVCIVIGLLLLGGIVEAISIGRPII